MMSNSLKDSALSTQSKIINEHDFKKILKKKNQKPMCTAIVLSQFNNRTGF